MKKYFQILTLVYVLFSVPFMPFGVRASWLTPESIANSAANIDASALSDPAYEVLAERVSVNQTKFYVYQDADSGFNHGFPSGFFGVTHKIHLDSACIDDPGSPTGCSEDPNVLDCDRVNVLRISFDPLSEGEYAGLNIEEPENWGISHIGVGYDVTGSTHIKFDVRSPDGIKVRFGVGGCSTAEFFEISTSWSSRSIPLDSFDVCPPPLTEPDITDLHILFTVVTNHENAPNGGTVLVDDIRFEPVPTSQESALSLPNSTKTCGVIPLQNPAPGCVSFPPDQVNRNVATIYEASLTLMALLERGTAEDLEDARLIADTIHYALHHENSGDPLPGAPDGSVGLHNAYECGDIALYNDQEPPREGKRGEVRLPGFSAQSCGPSGFCLVLDGATGGNNAFAILALAGAYERFKEPHFLEDALTIGNWIHSNLRDATYEGYRGYYLGYPDEGIVPKTLQKGKSVENNADIFAAFMELAFLERQRGHQAEANQWTLRAYVAGDFVTSMYDEVKGRFYAGTVPVDTSPEWGIDPSGPRRGNDVINVFDFLDSNTFSTLALATFPRYRDLLDWRRPIQYVLDMFAQSITAGGQEYHGFNIVKDTEGHGPNGIAWEFTAQAVVAMRFVDRLYGDTRFEEIADFYFNQIRQAQMMAPFADQRGLVASTLKNGDSLPSHEQCLCTPFQCIPERIGLAGTTWAIFAERNINPFPAIKLYVDWETGIDDDNECTNPAYPCETIGHALDLAWDGDTILVAEGTYTENLVITKTVTLKGAYEPVTWSRSLRRYTTTIDGNRSVPVIRVESTLFGTTVIDGFTITNGNGGISTLLSNLAVHNSEIVHNHNIDGGGGSGGGMIIDHSFVTIINTIIANNRASQHDGAIRIISTIAIPGPNSEVKINSSTIAYNRADLGRHGIFCSLSFCIVVNSIVWGHEGEDFSGLGYHATYSDIEMCLDGEGNICEDPRFVDPDNGDYHLQSNSPCIDRDTNDAPELPDTDFEGDPRVVDGDNDGTATVDMGADEYYVGQPVPDIKANGSDGPLTIPQGSNLTVTITLGPGSHTGENADWWVVADTPFGWYYYNLSLGWQPGFVVTYQGPLFDLSTYEVLNTSGLPVRAYTFYFGVDLLMNGFLDFGQLYYDSVDVNINE